MKNAFDKIVLIGFRGAGKSTVGRVLARELDWLYRSTDEQIEEVTGLPIPEIVARHGWDFFREKESAVVGQLAADSQIVIDCGGGVVENPQNMALLGQNSLIVWIDADLEDLKKRLRKSGNRPLLNQPDLDADIEQNYRRRYPLYQHYSAARLNTSAQDVDTIARQIIETFRIG